MGYYSYDEKDIERIESKLKKLFPDIKDYELWAIQDAIEKMVYV